MQMSKITSLIFLSVFALAAGPSLASCPDVQLPGLDDPLAAAARSIYLADVLVDGDRQVLEQVDFCPFEEGPEIVLVEKQCSDEGQCNARYAVTEWSEHVSSEQRIIKAEVSLEAKSDGSDAQGLVVVSDFGLDGLAVSRNLSAAQSQLFMVAMTEAGVPRDRTAVGADVRKAGFLRCQKRVEQGAVPVCSLGVLDSHFPVEESRTTALHRVLKDLGGSVVVGELEFTTSILVTCSRSDGEVGASCTAYAAPL